MSTYITDGSSAKKAAPQELARVSTVPKRFARPEVEDPNGEPIILRSPFFKYDDHGLSSSIHGARVQLTTGEVTDSSKLSSDSNLTNNKERTDDTNGTGSDGPSGPKPPSGSTSTQTQEASLKKPVEKKMSSASTLLTLGLTTGALILGSIGISLSPINEDLKKFLHVCTYSLTLFTGILLAALGMTSITNGTAANNKNETASNSSEEV